MNPIVCCQDLQVRQEVQKLGVLILLWRRQLGMTQYQLADKSGLAQSYISDLESGAVDPRWSTDLQSRVWTWRNEYTRFFEWAANH